MAPKKELMVLVNSGEGEATVLGLIALKEVAVVRSRSAMERNKGSIFTKPLV